MATSIEYFNKMLGNPNIQAALKTIRFCEGTLAEDGYAYMFTSSPKNDLRITDFAQHPNRVITASGISSTAAGAYQILKRTDDELNKTYGFTDFQPHTQDLKCVALLDRRDVLNSVANGFFLQEKVMSKLSQEWASMPFSRYGQPTKSMQQVREYYLSVGGKIGA